MSRFALRVRKGGGVVALLAVGLATLLAFLALAADLGLIYKANLEAQRAADAAALAAMGAMIETPSDPDRVRAVAETFAAANTIQGDPVALLDGDVEVSLASDTFVRVTVERSPERENALPTVFAAVLGIDAVTLRAIAESAPGRSGSVTCLKPFLVPDGWDDADGDGEYDEGEFYDPDVTGYGTDWRGDRDHDLGRQVVLYPEGNPGGSGPGSGDPSWYYLFRLPGNAGANDLREAIASSECDPTVYVAGQEYDKEPGANHGPVEQGTAELIDGDPGAYWNDATNTVEGSAYGENWTASPRVVRIALFDPSDGNHPSDKDVRVTNFATVFIEQSGGDAITARLMPAIGVGDNCTSECAAFMAYPRLVR